MIVLPLWVKDDRSYESARGVRGNSHPDSDTPVTSASSALPTLAVPHQPIGGFSRGLMKSRRRAAPDQRSPVQAQAGAGRRRFLQRAPRADAGWSRAVPPMSWRLAQASHFSQFSCSSVMACSKDGAIPANRIMAGSEHPVNGPKPLGIRFVWSVPLVNASDRQLAVHHEMIGVLTRGCVGGIRMKRERHAETRSWIDDGFPNRVAWSAEAGLPQSSNRVNGP